MGGIRYQASLDGVTPEKVSGFFVGWRNPLSPEKHLRILEKSYRVILAIDEESDRVVGFINAISDGIFAAYIPLLEVLPEYQRRGIGTELVRRMLEYLKDLHMVDLVCDEELTGFYQRLGMFALTGMCVRNNATPTKASLPVSG